MGVGVGVGVGMGVGVGVGVGVNVTDGEDCEVDGDADIEPVEDDGRDECRITVLLIPSTDMMNFPGVMEEVSYE